MLQEYAASTNHENSPHELSVGSKKHISLFIAIDGVEGDEDGKEAKVDLRNEREMCKVLGRIRGCDGVIE